LLVLAPLFAWLILAPPALQGQSQAVDEGIAVLLQQLEEAIRTDTTNQLLENAPSGNAPGMRLVVRQGYEGSVTRAAVRLRDRLALPDVPAGDGYRLAVEVFTEFGSRARLSTWRLDVVRAEAHTGDRSERWLIRDYKTLSSLGNLCRLSLDDRVYSATNLVLSAEDLEIRLPAGFVFTAGMEEGVTALVLVGNGQVVFRPGPASEKQQMRIFARSDVLDTPFTAVFVRVPPGAFKTHMKGGTLTEQKDVPEKAVRQAREVFGQDVGKSYGLNLDDMSDDLWSLMPIGNDFLAELHTRKFGVLTYARTARDPEDITLFDRTHRRNVSVYMSERGRAEHGQFYSDEDGQDFDVVHYDIDASFDPARQTVNGLALLTIRTLSDQPVNSLTLRLAESLSVRSVVSREFGRLLAVRVRNQNTIVVNLPKAVLPNTVLGMDITYSGRLAPQFIDREAIQIGQEDQGRSYEAEDAVPLEPHYLYSNRSYWYPQGQVSTFATATLRLHVPAGLTCVASGEPDAATLEALGRRAAPAQFVFRAVQPVRYLAVLISRLGGLRVVDTGMIEEAPVDTRPDGVNYRNVQLRTLATRRLRDIAGEQTQRAADILRFYGSIMGDYPYPTLMLTLVERDLPGGHSPPYMAIVSQPVTSSKLDWRSDPASFPDYPEFFLAHEIAHQWWGEGIGWKNYHEQWLSEGLAQYFAAMYAEHLRGRDVFDGIIERLQGWALKESDEGPIYLGYRVGHLKRDSRLYRAVVYNKSAAVLHMLRRLLGDEHFFGGLRRFYKDWRFRNAGSEDLRRAFEQETGRSLSRFFERWIYGSTLPHLRFSSRLEQGSDGRQDVVLRFEQVGELFDVPVTVTLNYADQPRAQIVVPVTEAVTETRVPLAGRLRKVEVNKDRAAVARIDGT
jgi:hypothetical protein